MNNGTLAAMDVLKDTVVTPMTKVTARTKTVPKSVKLDANVSPVTLAIISLVIASPRTTVSTVHGAPMANTLANACTIAMNLNAVVAGVTLTMVPVIKAVLVMKGSCVITCLVSVFHNRTAGFKNAKIMIRSPCGSRTNVTANFTAAVVNSADFSDQFQSIQRRQQLRQQLQRPSGNHLHLTVVPVVVLVVLLAGRDVPVNQGSHGIRTDIFVSPNKNVLMSLNVPKVRFTRVVNTAPKTPAPSLVTATEALQPIHPVTWMRDGNTVQSAAVSVPKEQSATTISTVQAAVLKVAKQQSVVLTNFGTLVHHLVVISIVKASMNVEIITMHDHVSNDVRVLTDMFATGTIPKVGYIQMSHFLRFVIQKCKKND